MGSRRLGCLSLVLCLLALTGLPARVCAALLPPAPAKGQITPGPSQADDSRWGWWGSGSAVPLPYLSEYCGASAALLCWLPGGERALPDEATSGPPSPAEAPEGRSSGPAVTDGPGPLPNPLRALGGLAAGGSMAPPPPSSSGRSPSSVTGALFVPERVNPPTAAVRLARQRERISVWFFIARVFRPPRVSANASLINSL